MAVQIIVLSLLVTSAYCSGGASSFSYGVSDPLTGDVKDQHEKRIGDSVIGQYSLLESDGTKRTVDYNANPISGFHAVVRKEPIGIQAGPIAGVPVGHLPQPAPGPVGPIGHVGPAGPPIPIPGGPIGHAVHVGPAGPVGPVGPIRPAIPVAPVAPVPVQPVPVGSVAHGAPLPPGVPNFAGVPQNGVISFHGHPGPFPQPGAFAPGVLPHSGPIQNGLPYPGAVNPLINRIPGNLAQTGPQVFPGAGYPNSLGGPLGGQIPPAISHHSQTIIHPPSYPRPFAGVYNNAHNAPFGTINGLVRPGLHSLPHGNVNPIGQQFANPGQVHSYHNQGHSLVSQSHGAIAPFGHGHGAITQFHQGPFSPYGNGAGLTW